MSKSLNFKKKVPKRSNKQNTAIKEDEDENKEFPFDLKDKEVVYKLKKRHWITPWEMNFLINISIYDSLSENQEAKLNDIKRKILLCNQ